MKKLFFIILALASILLITPKATFAQMGMLGGYQGQPTLSPSDLQDEQNMQNAGQKIYQGLQDKKVTCIQLTNNDYEKLGEYFMGQSAGSTQNHVYWDQRIQSMMGDQGDTQMHIIWGERDSGCIANAPIPSNAPSFFNGMMNYQNAYTRGGGFPIMGWGYNYTGMMNGNFGWGFGLVGFLFWLVIFVDLILLGVFLWKKIQK